MSKVSIKNIICFLFTGDVMPALTTKKKSKAKKKKTKRKTKVKKARKKAKPKRARRLPRKELFKEKPFTEGIRKKEEMGAGTLVLPIIFFVLTLAAFAISTLMPNECGCYMPIVGLVCFILFIVTFINSMAKLNKLR